MTTAEGARRVRVHTTDEGGLPVVRYGLLADAQRPTDGGTASGGAAESSVVVVLLDGPDAGTVTVDRRDVEPLELTSFELHLTGSDLLADPALRRGLVGLWAAEAEAAGLRVDALHPAGDGLRDSSEGYLLAELVADGQHFVLRAVSAPPRGVVVRVDRPNRWEL